MKFDIQTETFLAKTSSGLKELLDLAPGANGGSDTAVSFWQAEGCTTPRISFLGPAGARVAEIVSAFTGMSLSEADLRQSVYEAAEPAMLRWLFDDGRTADSGKERGGLSIRQMHGERWNGLIVSGGLLNVVLPNGSMDSAIWIDRVSVPIVVTSARAVLGTAETGLIRRFRREGRFFVLLVTALEGNEKQAFEARSEIDAYRIKPFMDEIGHFDVVYRLPGQSWTEDLSKIVMTEVVRAHCRQIVFVAQRWIDDWSQRLEQLWAEDQLRRRQVNDVRMHLSDSTIRLIDIARRLVTNMNLNITDLYSALENTADKTSAHFVANIADQIETIEDLVEPMKRAWMNLDETIKGVLPELFRLLGNEWGRETDTFAATYRSILVHTPIAVPEINAAKYETALQTWNQLSLEKLIAYIAKSLEEMQNKYQSSPSDSPAPIIGENSGKLAVAVDILKKMRLQGSSQAKMEYEVSSMITEGLRRYVRDRMNAVLQALDEDLNAWLSGQLHHSLDAWRIAINGQLDAQLEQLMAEKYKGMLLPHRDAWRLLSLQVDTLI